LFATKIFRIPNLEKEIKNKSK